MTSEQYNQTIINFYSNAFLQLSLSLKNNDININVQQKAKELTDSFATNFNTYAAKDFLTKLANENVSIQDKLKNYPEQFWLTSPGRDYFDTIQNNITLDMVNAIISTIKNNEKLDYNMLNNTVDNLITIYKQDIVSGKKQLLKLKKEFDTNKSLKNLKDLLPLLRESIHKNKTKDKLLKNIKDDFELLF